MSSGTDVGLRPVRPEDAEAMCSLYTDNWAYLQPWMPRRDPARFGTDAYREDLERECAEHAAGLAYYFAMVAGGALIGRVSLTHIVRRVWQNANLGYWIAESHAGQGLTSTAVRHILGFAFQTASLHRVQAAVIPRNLGSLRVVEKVGMRREGLAERYLNINGAWEDHVIYAITAEEWPGHAAS